MPEYQILRHGEGGEGEFYYVYILQERGHECVLAPINSFMII